MQEDLCYDTPVTECSLHAVAGSVLDIATDVLPILTPILDSQGIVYTVVDGVIYIACDVVDLVQGILDAININLLGLIQINLGEGIQILQKNTIPIKHANTDGDLSDVQVIADNSLLQSLVGLVDFCGVDGSPGNCQRESALQLNLGYLGLVDLLGDAIVYDMPNMAVADGNHSVFALTTLNIDILALLGNSSSPLLYGRYAKNGETFGGLIASCSAAGGGGSGEPSVPSTADIVDTDEYPNFASRRVLKTKVAGNPQTALTVVYLDPTTHAPKTFNSSGEFKWLPPLEVLLYRTDSSCTDELPLAAPTTGNPAGEPVIAYIESGTSYADANTFTMAAVANSNTRILAKYADWGDLLNDLESASSCFLNSNWAANLNGLPQCLNNLGSSSGISQELIEKYPNIATVCLNPLLTGEQQPCSSSAYDNSGSKGFILPEKYNHAYGCLACILDNAADVTACSSDNFAIRPSSYTLELSDPTTPKIAGMSYTLASDALYVGGGTAPTSGYTTTLDNTNDKNASFIFSPVAAATNCPYGDHGFTFSFTDGVGSGSISYPNVGDVNITLADANWTGVDQNKVGWQECLPDSNRTSPDPVGCLVTARVSERFIPDHFDVNASLDNAGSGFTYLYDMNKDNDVNQTGYDYNLSTASLEIEVSAMGANGIGTLSNYLDSCYAQDTNITLQTAGTQISPPSALDYFLYFNPTEADPNVSNSGEGKTALPANGLLSSLPITNVTASFPSRTAPDANGTTLIAYRINFDRRVNQPVNPFRLSLSSVDIVDTDGVYGSDNSPSPDTATFLYGRVHAPRYRIDCSSAALSSCSSTQPLQLFFEFYSSDNNLTLRRQYALDNERSKDAILWFRNTDHSALLEGNITVLSHRYNGYNLYTTSAPLHQNGGIGTPAAGASSVSIGYDGSRGYPYKSSIGLHTQKWLNYDRFNTDPDVNSSFMIEFNAVGQKTGEGNVPNTDSGPANSNRRIMW
ncbi:hypothetical protein [Sulfurimonas diazotrophicus]|uniref:Uncharacterized protein n=1 Tax=Sulfurimonas diazotrophicus TaxID=3131939 RepID=A0ABZ3H7X6_9BACT